LPRLRDPRTWLILGLVLSWLAMLILMRHEFWTFPAPEVLQRERMVRAPTMQSLVTNAVRSGVELLLLTLLLWPGRAYAVRLATTTAGLIPYYVLTTPLGITSVDQVYRRWLAIVALVLLLATILTVSRVTVRMLRT
jgi:hypothetical protein